MAGSPRAAPIAERCAVRNDDGGAGETLTRPSDALSHPMGEGRGEGLLPQLPHDELQKEQRGFAGLFVFGEIALNPLLFLAPNGGLVRLTSTRSRSPMSALLKARLAG